MAEIEKVAEEVTEVANDRQPTNPPQTQKEGFGAKVKEFFRKQGVMLKRKPQRIAFLFLCVVTIYNLLTLATFSEAIVDHAKDVEWIGLMVFINTLFSILILVAFLNTFPKLKKPGSKATFTMTESGVKLNINIPMLVVVILMALAMIACEIVYYCFTNPFYISDYVNKFDSLTAEQLLGAGLISKTLTMCIAHIVLLGVFLVLLLTLPLYRKLIMKIDTSKVIESTEIKEVIDTVD